MGQWRGSVVSTGGEGTARGRGGDGRRRPRTQTSGLAGGHRGADGAGWGGCCVGVESRAESRSGSSDGGYGDGAEGAALVRVENRDHDTTQGQGLADSRLPAMAAGLAAGTASQRAPDSLRRLLVRSFDGVQF